MECIKCNNRPYVGKIETIANERINNHRKNTKKPNSNTSRYPLFNIWTRTIHVNRVNQKEKSK